MEDVIETLYRAIAVLPTESKIGKRYDLLDDLHRDIPAEIKSRPPAIMEQSIDPAALPVRDPPHSVGRGGHRERLRVTGDDFLLVSEPWGR